MFTLSSISRKLTVFYGALFALAIFVAIFAANKGIERHAEANIERELAASTEVFNRVLAAQSDQMREAAFVTASDFGFAKPLLWVSGPRSFQLSII